MNVIRWAVLAVMLAALPVAIGAGVWLGLEADGGLFVVGACAVGGFVVWLAVVSVAAGVG